MKKLTFLLIIFVVYNINAQEFNPVKFGVKAGMNFSSFTGDDSEKYSSLTRLQFGGFINYKLDEIFTFQAEAILSYKGATLIGNDTGYKTIEQNVFSYKAKSKVVFRLNYFEIPILVKVMMPFDFFNFVKPYIELGLSLAEIMYSEVESHFEIKNYLNGNLFREDAKSAKNDISKHVKDLDLGINLGGGFNISNNLGINLRYFRSLDKFFDEGSFNNTGEVADLKNQVWALTINYSF